MPKYRLKFRGKGHSWHTVEAKDARTARRKFTKNSKVDPYKGVLLKRKKK